MNRSELADSERVELLVLSSFNVSNFSVLLGKNEENPAMEAIAAPFGQVLQTLLQSDAEVWRPTLWGAMVWTSPEAVSPSYKALLEFGDVEPKELLRDVDRFCSALKQIPPHVKHVLVPSWVMDPARTRLGALDMHPRRGLALALMRMNVRLAEVLQEERRFLVLDSQRWVSSCGPNSFSSRLWHMSKTPFAPEFFKFAVQEVKAAVRALRGRSRKLLVVDLDDTLWGGVVGEVGWQNIRLGGHDGIGEAYREFQMELKRLKNRGVLLAIVSKNEESTARQAIDSHPEMLLKADDFVGWRINWQDKAGNIADLAAELGLGLESVVFIDDNPVERARVRDALPDVLVPDWPANPMDYSRALNELRCFDVLAISAEDRQRTDMYVTEHKRREARANVTSLEEWLEALQLKVIAEPLALDNLERATQLLNKTNQMNLSTRRLTAEEFYSWSEQPENSVMVFRTCDRFGDYGLVGIGSIAVTTDTEAQVVDFLLSCRVMGRKVEETMLHVLTILAQSRGASRLFADYVVTPRNQPCGQFFEGSGMVRDEQSHRFWWSLGRPYNKPRSVNLVAEIAHAFSAVESGLV